MQGEGIVYALAGHYRCPEQVLCIGVNCIKMPKKCVFMRLWMIKWIKCAKYFADLL